MKHFISLFLIVLPLSVFSQTAPDKYWVQFTDKIDSPYSIDQPEKFLSFRAIDRRARYNIDINESDLPVNPAYMNAIDSLGADILHSSKWFNGISIYLTNPLILEDIRELPFVSRIKTVITIIGQYPIDKFEKTFKSTMSASTEIDSSFYDYGDAANQIGMIKGHVLHNQGFHGEGMIIAVLDGGFTRVNTNPAFDSLRNNNQILGNWDFVKNQPLSFEAHTHGGHVLSVMAANIPGVMIGSAPKASYYLLRTEDGGSEFRIEEDNWVAGAEYADSAGADLINSSLGYTKFTDSGMDYTYEDLDGNTTRITQAADMAASKGILVVNSAANEGNTDWKYIGAPADGDSVLTVGAVDSNGDYASFSSIGPTADGRIKPNISAQGKEAALANSYGDVIFANGTSFSSPLICGMTACLWQANKYLNNMELIDIIQKSASQADSPDAYLGYGIPDYGQAFFSVLGIDSFNTNTNDIVRIFPNPFTSYLTVDYYSPIPKEFELRIVDLQGRLAYQKNFDPGYLNLNRIKLTDLNGLSSGVYFIQIVSDDLFFHQKVIKQTY